MRIESGGKSFVVGKCFAAREIFPFDSKIVEWESQQNVCRKEYLYYFCARVSLTRPAPAESSRVGRQQR